MKTFGTFNYFIHINQSIKKVADVGIGDEIKCQMHINLQRQSHSFEDHHQVISTG